MSFTPDAMHVACRTYVIRGPLDSKIAKAVTWRCLTGTSGNRISVSPRIRACLHKTTYLNREMRRNTERFLTAPACASGIDQRANIYARIGTRRKISLHNRISSPNRIPRFRTWASSPRQKELTFATLIFVYSSFPELITNKFARDLLGGEEGGGKNIRDPTR